MWNRLSDLQTRNHGNTVPTQAPPLEVMHTTINIGRLSAYTSWESMQKAQKAERRNQLTVLRGQTTDRVAPSTTGNARYLRAWNSVTNQSILESTESQR